MRLQVALTTGTVLATVGVILVGVGSCATEEFANASPEVADDCRREVALLRDTDTSAFPDDLQDSAPESGPDPVEDARRAQEAAGGVILMDWPEDVLMYRCLQSRGVVLTAEQAAILAEWDDTLDADDNAARPRE